MMSVGNCPYPPPRFWQPRTYTPLPDRTPPTVKVSALVPSLSLPNDLTSIIWGGLPLELRARLLREILDGVIG